MSVAPFLHRKGGVVITHENLTSRKNAELELARANEELYELKNRLEVENVYLSEEIRSVHDAGEIIGRVLGTIGTETDLSDDDRGVMYSANINPVEDLPGVGRALMGSRTLEDGEFNQINVRRTFIFFRASLKDGTRFVLFEPNTKATRAKVRRTVAAFMETEWRKNNLEGDIADEAFFVVCDESNNPAITINQGKMFVSVGVNIPKTTEFLVIEIQQDQRGIEASLGV